jgi:lysophospholipase L1-like esterase
MKLTVSRTLAALVAAILGVIGGALLAWPHGGDGAAPASGLSQDWTGGVANRRAQAALSRLPHPKIVLLGDSQFALASWQDLTGCALLSNRAAAGASAIDLQGDARQVATLGPELVVVEAGINDLQSGRSASQLVAAIESLVAALKPARVVVVSILPVAHGFGPDRLAAEVHAANAQLSQRRGADFLDVTATFADERGYLRRDFTTDGVHLRAAGYAAYRDALAPLIDRACGR